jgi:ABC-2 type transport system ATP-binding protein
MGITEKTGGTVALFGEPPGSTDLVRARQRIGYVAQEQTFYGWMTPAQLGRFVGAFYPTWDAQEYRRLCTLLELPLDRKIQGFSGGMRVKVALALALAHRPPLLLLDEPTAGLDPVARRELLEIVESEARASGRTTFFSSHLIDEVELVAQRVGIVDGGKTRYEGSVRALGERVRLLTRPAAGARSTLTAALTVRGLRVLFTEERDGEDRLFVEADDPALFTSVAAEHALAARPIDLEEIFIAMVRHSQGAAGA